MHQLIVKYPYIGNDYTEYIEMIVGRKCVTDTIIWNEEDDSRTCCMTFEFEKVVNSNIARNYMKRAISSAAVPLGTTVRLQYEPAGSIA